MNSNTMDFSVITESDIDPGYMSMNNKRVRHFVERHPTVGIKSSVKSSCQKIIQQLKILFHIRILVIHLKYQESKSIHLIRDSILSSFENLKCHFIL